MIPPNFYKIIKDFVTDLFGTFPELKNNAILSAIESKSTDEAVVEYATVYDFVLKSIPAYFMNILHENDDMFKEDCLLLPDVNFKLLWNEEISDKTKTILWKYLKLILFVVMGQVNPDQNISTMFQDATVQTKMKDAIDDIKTFFENKGGDAPDTSDFQNTLESMMSGKIGSLAKEIAEGTIGSEPQEEMLKNMLNNPTKMFDLMNNVGDTISNKIKSGQLKESELLEEASEMMKHMKDMPGMKQFEQMFKQFGNMNVKATQGNLDQKIKKAKTKERLRAKLDKRAEEKK